MSSVYMSGACVRYTVILCAVCCVLCPLNMTYVCYVHEDEVYSSLFFVLQVRFFFSSPPPLYDIDTECLLINEVYSSFLLFSKVLGVSAI